MGPGAIKKMLAVQYHGWKEAIIQWNNLKSIHNGNKFYP